MVIYHNGHTGFQGGKTMQYTMHHDATGVRWMNPEQTDTVILTADAMRRRFWAVPREVRDTHQSWSIRIWRGLSWLERAEQALDPEGRLISLWIAFNSIYGHEDDANRPASDRASWQSFLARIWKLECPDRLGEVLCQQAPAIRRLIDCKYLFRPFWLGLNDWKSRHNKAVRAMLSNERNGNTLALLQQLFEQLYMLRVQVFHGAATSGSKYKTKNIEDAISVLAGLVPLMIDIILTAGPEQDWGEVCYPPIHE
jgi:hypothetical protein